MVYVFFFLYSIYITPRICLDPPSAKSLFSQPSAYEDRIPSLLPIKDLNLDYILQNTFSAFKKQPPLSFHSSFNTCLHEADIGQCDIIHVSRCDSLDQ